MKIDIDWIKSAQNALCELGVVDKNGCCPDEFNGYVSSLSVAIAQMGLIPALLVYERDIVDWADLKKERDEKKRNEKIVHIKSSDADNNRVYVIHAIESVLLKHKCIAKETKEFYFLSSYIIGRDTQYQEELLRDIQKSLVALKLALRFYKEKEGIKLKKTIATRLNSNTPIATVDASYVAPTENANIGYLFYRDLYRHESKNCQFNNGTKTDYFKNRISAICNVEIKASDKNNLKNIKLGNSDFFLKTTYPGLLIGSGLSHGLSDEGDIKLGFSFDYTSGLPYIPGSSIKGVLRSVFPTKDGDSRVNYLNGFLSKELNYSDYCELEEKLFNGQGNNKLIYFDAFISQPNENKRILGNDYITPHKEALKEPVPIQFLKVLPDVVFQFQFKIPEKIEINNKAFTQGDIKKLFEQILLDLGVGAKTNVGYGHFKKVENSQSNKQ